MSTKKPVVPQYRQWEPPEDMWLLLKEDGLKTRDKVEIVFAFFSKAHGGATAYASEVAKLLDTSKKNVERCMDELLAQGRASKVDGRFILVNSVYTHPITREYIEDI